MNSHYFSWLKPILFLLLILLLSNTSLYSKSSNVQQLLDRADSLMGANKHDDAHPLLIEAENLLASLDNQDAEVFKNILMGEYYLDKKDYAQSRLYFEKVKAVSDQTFSSQRRVGVARAVNDLGIVYYEIGEIQLAKSAHFRSIELYKKCNEPQGLAFNYNNLSIIAKEQKQIDSAIFYSNQCIEVAQSIKDTLGLGYSNLQLAMLYIDNQDHVKGLDHYHKALAIFDYPQFERQQVMVQRRLGQYYVKLTDYQSAKSFYKQVLIYYKKQAPASLALAKLYNDIGELYIKTEEFDSSNYYINQAFEILEEKKSRKPLIRNIHLKAYSLDVQGKYDDALTKYNEALYEAAGKYLGEEINLNLAIARIYARFNTYHKVKEYVERAYQIKGKEALSEKSRIDAHQLLYQVYKSFGNYQLAATHLENYQKLHEQLMNKDRGLEIARIEYRNQLKREEALKQAIQEKKELAYQQEINRRTWIQYSALGAAILVSIIAIILYRFYTTKKADNEKLAEYTEELRQNNDYLHELRLREQELSAQALASKERELATMAMASLEKNNILGDIQQRMNSLEGTIESEQKSELKKIKKLISNNLKMDNSWDSFLHKFEDIHPQFFEYLKDRNPNLTVNDLKLCAYIKIGMTNKEIANVSNLVLSSVKSSINRLKKKIGLPGEESIRDFIIKL